MEKGTVVNRLTAWSRWKMASGVALGYPSKVSFMRIGTGGDIPTDRDGHDAWCHETNDVVNQLPLFHQLIIRIEYLSEGGNTMTKAHKVGVDQRTFRRYLSNAYEQIGNIFNSGLRCCPNDDINMLDQLEVRQDQTQQTG